MLVFWAGFKQACYLDLDLVKAETDSVNKFLSAEEIFEKNASRLS